VIISRRIVLTRFISQTLELLELAAYFGARFDVRDIAEFRGVAVEEVESLLWKALHQGMHAHYTHASAETRRGVTLMYTVSVRGYLLPPGFVLRESDFEYRFLHDRVQQAAYECVDQGSSKLMHLAMARFMLTRVDTEEDLAVRFLYMLCCRTRSWSLVGTLLTLHRTCRRKRGSEHHSSLWKSARRHHSTSLM
jgi:predicted ATPase